MITIKNTLEKLRKILYRGGVEVYKFYFDEDENFYFAVETEEKEQRIQLGNLYLEGTSTKELNDLLSYIDGYYQAVKIHKK